MRTTLDTYPRACARVLDSTVPAGADPCRVIQDLSLLVEIAQTMESSLEVRDIVRPTLAKMASSMGMTRGAITLRRDDQAPAVVQAVGLDRHESPQDYWGRARPLFDQVIARGRAVVVTDMAKDEHFGNRRFPLGEPMAFLCVPVKHGDDTLGTLSIERCAHPRSTLSADVNLLRLIARMMAQAVHLRETARSRLKALRDENARLQEQIQRAFKPGNMVGNSTALQLVYRHIEQVAGSDATVLIRGESGVGKELVAHALHQQSARKPRNFVKFSCAALPESIIESELFGHEKGAFTGAIATRRGRFELADGGTIFLDEIGDLTPATQVKLLRVLQEREFERVGSSQAIPCNVRVIAATSRNLEAMLEDGQFRSDLYYRLNVFPIYVPSLRERKSDLLPLTDHFIEKCARRCGKPVRRISTAAIDLIMAYHWPGNVRELENCIERAVLLCEGDSVEAQHLPPTLQMPGPEGRQPSGGTLRAALNGLEHELICAELKATGGNMAEAARHLGITERIMGLRVKQYRIDFKRFRPRTPS
ncbi:MAG: sigma 54-interacting transcriptional regulator [Verrucomicrobiales bacterium]|nr:sigma 54-interacting transcriptional regulator [Verrucomicrobiales bacterium]